MKTLRRSLPAIAVGSLLSLFLSGHCFATGADLVLRGNVTEQTCTASAGSQNFFVELGSWATPTLNGSAGKVSPEKPFSIQLEGCPAVAISIIFTGNIADGSSNLLAIDSGNDTAKNVAIELLNDDMSRLGLSDASRTVTADASGNATFHFYARYISTASQVTAGQANASSVFTISYN
ncbi:MULTISPECIES: fimbrial protein [unclassified Tatumella]|uniref:fimbrial protein n=1 Tax=unclassified Tatumella TaxID=2649542 RepID=UPI001BAE97EF|nr:MULTISPECIES: fimbrial protein [unclassified Tatumella]MBS0856590.1 fimbrial protein [Tatumella sp. JGM16]MBS0877925.1 fimbrial protein [Tatumella sp. JGM82]MBS0891631.1 fimbrial protein [Tatumella sp. JGM94]MBS0893824.1 fimbrial protein [Tatumella sp. JGM130]MBS0902545.1 fimbrial protein [Tatumella sp. JGM100]